MSMAFDGTNGLVFPDNSTQPTAARGFGFKNRIINGAMQIDQRNAGASVSFSGSSAYTLDRWKAQSPAGTVQRISAALSGHSHSLKYTSSGSNSYLQIGQQIEYGNCYDLQNQTVSISFKAKANNSNGGSTGLVVRTRTVAGVDGAALFTSANADTSVTLTTSEATYTVTRTLPSSFGALSLEFVLGSHVSGDGFEITGVQLEKGPSATSFDYRPYGAELALCQRYFEKSFDTETAPSNGANGTSLSTTNGMAVGWSVNSTIGGMYVKFQVAKRAVPTLTSYGNSSGYWFAGAWGSLAAYFSHVGTSGYSITQQQVAGQNITYGHWTASAEL